MEIEDVISNALEKVKNFEQREEVAIQQKRNDSSIMMLIICFVVL
jgi:hypothetical protein